MDGLCLFNDILLTISSHCDALTKVMLYRTSKVFTGLVKGLLRKYRVSTVAACYGYMNILEWSIENGCELNGTIIVLKERVRSDATMVCAARRGDLEMMKWLYSKGCPCPDRVSYVAAENGHVKVLKWLDKNEIGGMQDDIQYYRFDVYHWLKTKAAKGDSVEVLEWLHEKGHDFLPSIANIAARHGAVRALEWLREHNYLKGSSVNSTAIRRGQLEVIKWLYDLQGRISFEELCMTSVIFGHLHVLKWVADCGKWYRETATRAADCGRLAILQWIVEHGLPYNKSTCLRFSRDKSVTEYLNSLPD